MRLQTKNELKRLALKMIEAYGTEVCNLSNFKSLAIKESEKSKINLSRKTLVDNIYELDSIIKRELSEPIVFTPNFDKSFCDKCGQKLPTPIEKAKEEVKHIEPKKIDTIGLLRIDNENKVIEVVRGQFKGCILTNILSVKKYFNPDTHYNKLKHIPSKTSNWYDKAITWCDFQCLPEQTSRLSLGDTENNIRALQYIKKTIIKYVDDKKKEIEKLYDTI